MIARKYTDADGYSMEVTMHKDDHNQITFYMASDDNSVSVSIDISKEDADDMRDWLYSLIRQIEENRKVNA